MTDIIDAAPSRQFLFLSDSSSEAATSRLAFAGIGYKRRKLESRIANWTSICELMDDGGLIAVLVKLTTYTMRAMVSSGYRLAADELLHRISNLPNIVFVHASFFSEQSVTGTDAREKEDEWFGAAAHFGSLQESEHKEVMKMLEQHGIELMPYRRNVELSVLAAQFVDDHRRNLVFRFYIPARRLWADQAGDLLELFKDYLIKAIGLKVRTSSHSSSNGTTYEFFTDEGVPDGSIEGQLPAFAEAMDLCVRDPDGAERLLVGQGADASEVARLVTVYAKRMKRITKDIRQEREHKVLTLRHQLENDLESIAEYASADAIAMLVDQVLPRADQAAGLLLGLSDPLLIPPTSNVTVNYRPQIIGRVQRRHQPGEDLGRLVLVRRRWTVGEAEARHRRDHDVECDGAGSQQRRDPPVFDEARRPSVEQKQRRRVGTGRTVMKEGDAAALDRGAVVGRPVERPHPLGPVVFVAPVTDELLQEGPLGAHRPAVDDRVRSPRAIEPAPQVLHHREVVRDLEGNDHGRILGDGRSRALRVIGAGRHSPFRPHSVHLLG